MGRATEPESPAIPPAAPITIDEAQPHVLIEEVTGLAVQFESAAVAVTLFGVTNPDESVA